LYEIFCKEGHITDIQLQPGEEPLYVGGGDTVRWVIDKAQSGSADTKQWHILVKPLKSKITTNLIITTDKHSYQVRVRAANFYNPVIGWTYPSEDKAAFLRQQAVEKKRADENISLIVTPDKLNFNYTIEARTSWYQSVFSWTPKLAFDDGTKTYIQMSPDMKSGEAPALFVKDDDGVNLVNYRVKDNYYIVDRLFKQAELRCGLKEVVVISRKDTK
jgi:type IV secretion system protein VirB9